MPNSSYIIYLPKEELSRFDNIAPYDYMDDSSTTNIFEEALYPIFNYYKKRTSNVTTYSRPSEGVISKEEGTLIIKETKSSVVLFLQKLIPRKNLLFVDTREVEFDVERTWNIISSSRTLVTYKRVYLAIRPWTKLVYAYRLDKVYGLEIIDVTTY